MRAHTKKHPTKNNVKDDDYDLIDSKEIFQDLFDKYTEQGVYLKGVRYREGLTQKELAKKLGITQGNLSAMENGKRPIGKEMAKRLSKILKTDYRIFL